MIINAAGERSEQGGFLSNSLGATRCQAALNRRGRIEP